MFRRRSSQSNKVGPVRRASILNTLAADEVINNDTATEADVPLARGTNPLFEDGAEEGGGEGSGGDRKEESDIAAVIRAESRRRSAARNSLTDNELQQVLGSVAPVSSSKGSLSKRRVSASTAGSAVVGSSIELGAKPDKHEELQKFMEHLKQQARATYVPVGCAEKILEQATTTAEETKARHQNVVVTLAATYREIDEKTKRHYAELILRLQREMRTELRRMAKEIKAQEELAENLRDKIASQTAAAAAREIEFASERERDRLIREREAAEFNAVRENMMEESRRLLGTAVDEAKKESESTAQRRTEDARRRSIQRMELEERAVRTTVALALSSVVAAVEEREHNQGRAELHRGLATAGSEAALLRAELAEAISKTQSLLAENAQLGKEGESLREETRVLQAELEERSRASMAAQGDQIPPTGNDSAEGELQNPPRRVDTLQGASEDEQDKVVRARLEKEEAAAMVEDENSFTVLLELVRHRREARNSTAKVAALSKLLEKEHAAVRQLCKEAETFTGSRDKAEGNAPAVSGEEEVATADDAAVSKKSFEHLEEDELDKDAREMKKAMEDVVAEQRALSAAEEDKKALGISIRRVAELEAEAASLKDDLSAAKREAQGALVAARNAEKQLMAASQAAAESLTAGTTTAESPSALEGTASAVAGAAAVGSPAGSVAMNSNASATAPPAGVEISSIVGGSLGLKIEQGPSSEALRLEELKSELQEVAAAKKKVKGEIKKWLKDFEEKEGRPAGNEDKGVIREQFVEHKKLEKTAAKLTSAIQALEVEIENKKNRAEAGGGEGAATAPNTPATPATPGFGGAKPVVGDTPGAGFQSATSATVIDAAATAALVEKLREENASLAVKLEESEKKKAMLKTALGELNNTTTKMLANVQPSASPSATATEPVPLSSSSHPDRGANEDGKTAGPPEQTLSGSQDNQAFAAEGARAKEQELEDSLRAAQEEAREAALAAKKAEHLRDEASQALEVARGELKACQLVVDEASEAARLREQVEALKVDLDAKSRAAIAGWDAAANAESEAEAAEARGLQAGIKRGRAEAEKRVRALQEELSRAASVSTASAAAAASGEASPAPTPTTSEEQAALGNEAKTSGVDELAAKVPAASAAAAAAATTTTTTTIAEGKAEELQNAERELENLREREQDARGEAERMADELQRASKKLEQQRERESGLVSAVAKLEKEKETLSRGLEMAQERAALALELVAAHTEEAAKARQESALNAAKFRRASRDIGQSVVASPETADQSSPKKTSGGRPQTSSGNRRAAEKLRQAAATLVRAIKEGTDLWRRQRREECHALYVKAGARAVSQMPPGQTLDDLRVAITAAKGLNHAKAAIALRKAFDTVIEAAMVAKEGLATQRNAARGVGSAVNSNRNSMSPSRAGSVANSTPASPSHSRKTSTNAGAAEENAAETAAAIAAAVTAAVPADTSDKDPEEGLKQDDSSSKVASLQRQLEALTARQKEAEVAAAAAVAAAVTANVNGFSDSDDSEEGEDEGKAVKAGSSMLEVATRRCMEMEDKVDNLEAECRALREALEEKAAVAAEEADPAGGKGAASTKSRGADGGARNRADQLKIKALEQKNKEEAAKARKLEAQVAKLESAVASATTAAAGKASKAEAKAAEAKTKAAEAKMKKEIEQAEAKSKKLGAELEAAAKGLESSKNETAQLKKERDELRQQVASMGSMGEEMQVLRTRAEDAVRLETELKEATANTARLEGLYQVEQVLRKKYWNMMEDMKGKIRVFARCRPFAQYEVNQNCKRAVRFIDESTVEVDGQHGPKQFVFDSVFSEAHGQADIFEDTRNLVQSALDGFNVCVFAYGQTGSGKTWTMTGGKGDQRGLTPRVIEEIFGNIEKARGALEVKVSCYFIELYLDNLRDLLYAMEHTRGNPPKLEIHMDANKMVVVKNVVTKEVTNANQLMHMFTAGNQQRKVGGTKMNAESSRSHSVFSILLEVYNKTSRKTTTGKLSLVDLAGSERADKTGATAERLKEAQSINKSLSALGDVISALSTNEKFVPYRNNKLTQVMQDSLGGNAKTLMFVNISPADYNQDETVTALTYATRVKLITNTAEKQQDGEEVSRLKETIRKLRAGEREDGESKVDAGG